MLFTSQSIKLYEYTGKIDYDKIDCLQSYWVHAIL